MTRDGALRSPKVGLLDALLQLSAEPGFDRDLVFVPVGINYDRVLEDEDRNRDLARLEGDVLSLEEAEEIVRLGAERLSRRRVAVVAGGGARIGPHPDAVELLEYYARSLSVLDGSAGAQPQIAASAR